MALHTPTAWPQHRADDIDEVIRLRGELAAATAQLDAANERARLLAADLSRVTQENVAQARIIWKQAHELDAMRRRAPGVVYLTDRLHDGYVVDDFEGSTR